MSRSSFVAASVATLSLALSATADAAAPCAWELRLVDGNGVDLFGAATDEAGGLWTVGASSSTSFPFPRRNFIARWNGEQWVTATVPQPTSDDQSLRAVAALGPDDAIAVGARDSDASPDSTPQALRWDGAAWSVMDAPTFTGGGFFDAVQRTGDTVWASGGAAFGGPQTPITDPFAARLDGDEWEVFELPLFEAMGPQAEAVYRMLAIDGVAADDVWIGGDLLIPGPKGADDAVVVHWDGSNWTWFDLRPLVSDPGTASVIQDLVALASDDVWAVGEVFDVSLNRTRPLLLHWDGDDWSRAMEPAEVDDNAVLRTVIARSPSDIFAAGTRVASGGGPDAFVLHYDGVAWSVLDDVSVAGGSQFFSGAVTSEGEAWLVGLTNEFPVLGLTQRAIACDGPCVGDLNESGVVDFADLTVLLAAWGAADRPLDLDGDGVVGLGDLLVVLAEWGTCR